MCRTVKDGPLGQMYKRNVKRTQNRFHGRDDFNCCGQNLKKSENQVNRYNPQRLETSRSFTRKKYVTHNKQSCDTREFDDNSHSLSTVNEQRSKEVHVITAEDIEDERDIHNKSKNSRHAHKDKKRLADHSKVQASIFRNALTKASSIGETSNTKRNKSSSSNEDAFCVESKEPEQPKPNEDDTSVFHYTEISSNNDISEQRTRRKVSAEKTIWNNPSLPKPVSGSSNTEPFAFKGADEVITRCNKESCTCSEDVLYCTVCDFHIDNQRELERHMKNASHDVRKKDHFRLKNLETLKLPSQTKLAAIEELLQSVFVLHVQDVEDFQLRSEIIKQLRNDLRNDIEGECTFHLFGSSVNGFGLHGSNISIDLDVPQGISPSKMLLKTFDGLKEHANKYSNLSKDFSATFPSVSFTDHKTKLSCMITLNNKESCNTSRLLKQYAMFDKRGRKLGVIFRLWAKICGIDQQEFCTLPSHCFPLMVIYFLQQTEPPVLPVLHEIAGEKDVLTHDLRNFWTTRNKQTLAELWMDLLKFYAVTFQYKTHVVAICQKECVLCTDKKWTTRMICIEDPYHTKRNVARSIANQQWFRYILECVRSTYEYFCTCRLAQAVNDIVAEEGNCSNEEEEESSQSLEDNSIDLLEDHDKNLEINSVIESIKAMELGNFSVGTSQKNSKRERQQKYNNTDYTESQNILKENKCCDNELENNNNLSLKNNAEENFVYIFEKPHMVGAKQPALYCRQCQRVNHVKKNCTIDDNLPELRKLPKMERDHKDILTDACENVFAFCRPSVTTIEQNRQLLSDLQSHIQHVFADARLELFGSSCNGFGFGDSDLDICLTFRNKNSEDLCQKDIIDELTISLNKYPKIRDILAIPTAKVPIIKFSFYVNKKKAKDGDISLYNTLGQHNTKLLSTYCDIDHRVQLLGYTLKFFAKICDICDASRGSLSSYAYILMAIFYLQQLETPVIPILQELYDHNEKMPENYVDGWNTWFYEDIDNLANVWQNYGKNKQSIGELWMGLLLFYTEKFKMGDYVISIRQKAPLTRFEKLWNTRSIAIEDPFDHSHNLGAGVSKKMNTFIIAAFRRGREQFGRIPPPRREILHLLDYFFDSKILTGGEDPPNERGCRKCGKIGHKMKECPQRHDNFRKRRNMENRNKASTDKQQGFFRNRRRFNDRNRADRQSAFVARETPPTYWNFRNFPDQQNETRRTVNNFNPNIQRC